MNFTLTEDFEQSERFETVSHLIDAAHKLDIDTSFTMGVDVTTDETQLQQVQEQLEKAIQGEQERLAAEQRKLYPCYIGPFAGGYCTICGLVDPVNPPS